MWHVVPSLEVVLQGLLPVFTEPTFVTHREIFLGWIVCLGRRTEFRVFEAFVGSRVSRHKRHPFDRFYNFFSRSAWTVQDLGRQVAIQLVMALQSAGVLYLCVDGTLLHKSGKHVWAIGWFHDPVASTKKRTATALGNKWVVMALMVPIPGTEKIFCLPIHAMLQQPGRGQPAEPELARLMLKDVLSWFPGRQFVLVGDGGFSGKKLHSDLDQRVQYVGLMRSDAALHEPELPHRRKGQRGPNRKHGLRLPSPRKVAEKADRAGSRGKARYRWQTVCVYAYGQKRRFQVCTFIATWPKVFGQRPIQVVLCRALDEGYEQVCLYTTDLTTKPEWVVKTYAQRNGIESTFKSSKQVLEIEQPQHRCRESIEKLAPWVWFTQSLVALWYLTEGRQLPEARAARRSLGEWETEWSFHHMLRMARRVTIRQAIRAMSHNKHDLQQLTEQLENYLYLAA